MPTPIIVPVYNPPRTINCIVQDGIRYCENQPITQEDEKMIGGTVLLFVVWILVFIYLIIEQYDKTWMTILWICVPFVGLGLVLIL